MATATINGTPSIFISAEPPTGTFPTYRDRVANFTAIAENMATEGEVDTDQAEQDWLNDSEAQADYQAWCEELEAQWLNDPKAQQEFCDWCDEAELESMAEEAELARLGDAGLHAIAGHDLKWQAGGN